MFRFIWSSCVVHNTYVTAVHTRLRGHTVTHAPCIPDQSIPLGHLPCAQSQTRGDDSWQAFRYGSHCQCYSNLEIVYTARQGELHCRGVRQGGVWVRLPAEEVLVVDCPHKHTYPEDDLHGVG